MNNDITKLRPNGGGAINLTSNGYLKLNKDSKVLVAVRYYGEEVALAKNKFGDVVAGECKTVHVLPMNLDDYNQTKDEYTQTLEERSLLKMKYKVVGEDELLDNYDLCLLNPDHANYGEWFEKLSKISNQVAAILPLGFIIDKVPNTKNRKDWFEKLVNENGARVEVLTDTANYFTREIRVKVCSFSLSKLKNKGIVVNGIPFDTFSDIAIVPKELGGIIKKLKIDTKDSIYEHRYYSTENATAKYGIVETKTSGFMVKAPEKITETTEVEMGMRLRLFNGETTKSDYKKNCAFAISQKDDKYPQSTRHYIWFETMKERDNYVEFLQGDYVRVICACYNLNGHNLEVYKNINNFDFTKKVYDEDAFKHFGLTYEDIKAIYAAIPNIYGVDRNCVIDNFGKRQPGETYNKDTLYKRNSNLF